MDTDMEAMTATPHQDLSTATQLTHGKSVDVVTKEAEEEEKLSPPQPRGADYTTQDEYLIALLCWQKISKPFKIGPSPPPVSIPLFPFRYSLPSRITHFTDQFLT